MTSGLRPVGQFVLAGMVTVIGGEYILEHKGSVLSELPGAVIATVGAVFMADSLRQMEEEVTSGDD